jgi:hypothetical protein
MLEDVGWADIVLLIISTCLCLFGLVTFFYVVALGVFRRAHQSPVRKVVAIFGMIGLLLPAVLWAVSLINIDVADALLRPLWPTSFILGAAESGDDLWYVILVFAAAILSNVGSYGLAGLIVGSVWTRRRHAASLGDQ